MERGAREGEEGDGGEAAEGRDEEIREVLKAADLFQAEGLLKHCLVAFGEGLTVGRRRRRRWRGRTCRGRRKRSGWRRRL